MFSVICVLLKKVAVLKGSAILLEKVIIVKLADWDTVKSNIFAKTAIQFVQRLPEARMSKSVVVLFWKGRAYLPAEHDLYTE